MKKILLHIDTRTSTKVTACDISTQELKQEGYLRMFQLLQKLGTFDHRVMDTVESQLHGQAVNGNGKAAMAFLLLVQEPSIFEVEVEDTPVPPKAVVKVEVTESAIVEQLKKKIEEARDEKPKKPDLVRWG